MLSIYRFSLNILHTFLKNKNLNLIVEKYNDFKILIKILLL